MKYWTKKEDDFLIENYVSMTNKEIGDCLGRSEPGVRNRCWRIGLNTKMSRPWTDEDYFSLRELYLQHEGLWFSLDEIAKKMGSSRWGIAMKASRLGLTDYARKKPGGRKDNRKFKGDDEALREHLSKTTIAWLEQDGHPRETIRKNV